MFLTLRVRHCPCAGARHLLTPVTSGGPMSTTMAVMTASNADLPPSATAGRTTARHGVPPELRSEVRVFGAALGQVLRESVGPDLLDDVERLRRAVIDTRNGEPDAESPADIVAGFDTVRAEQVARAFTVYFQMANLAEERQRVRALRGRTASDRPDSFSGLVGRLEPDELAAMLPGLRVHPVLTAHPTEARRRAAVTAIHRVGEAIDLPDETARERRLLEEVTSLWRTAQLRDTKPGPIDEVRTAMAVFDESLFAMVPTVYRAFEAALSGPDAGTRPPTVPTYLRLGSWIGGDRDGNPNVTAPITREALDVQADHVLVALTDATERLASTLTPVLPGDAAVRRTALRRRAGRRPAPGPDHPAVRRRERAAPRVPALRRRPARRHPRPPRRPRLPGRRRVRRRPAAAAGLARRGGRRAHRLRRACRTCSGRPRRSGSTWPSSRCASTPGCTPRRWPATSVTTRATPRCSTGCPRGCR